VPEEREVPLCTGDVRSEATERTEGTRGSALYGGGAKRPSVPEEREVPLCAGKFKKLKNIAYPEEMKEMYPEVYAYIDKCTKTL